MFNLVVLTGRLTADTELKTTNSGISVTSFSIAVNRNYRAGEQQQTDFINIVAWRHTAEFINKNFKKGDRRASKTSSENLGGFINKPWKVQRRTLEGSRKDLGGSKNSTFTDYLKTYYT